MEGSASSCGVARGLWVHTHSPPAHHGALDKWLDLSLPGSVCCPCFQEAASSTDPQVIGTMCTCSTSMGQVSGAARHHREKVGRLADLFLFYLKPKSFACLP